MIKVPVRSGSPFGVESFVAFLAQETINHTRGTTKIRVPKSINKKYFFLEGLATPPSFIDFISPKLNDPNRLEPNRTDLELFGVKKDTESRGCPGATKKTRRSL